MEYSEAGLKLTMQMEGLRLTAYQDSVGVWTIGWGHTGPDVHEGLVWTIEQAKEALRRDVEMVAVPCVNKYVMLPILEQNQFDALVDFTFNVGCAAFRTSTLLKKINLGDIAGAADEFLKWRTANRRVLPGLVRRRALERQMFLYGPGGRIEKNQQG